MGEIGVGGARSQVTTMGDDQMLSRHKGGIRVHLSGQNGVLDRCGDSWMCGGSRTFTGAKMQKIVVSSEVYE